MAEDNYKTRMVVEIEVEHHSTTPRNVISMIQGLLKVPAVTGVDFLSGKTNYRLFGEPGDELQSFDLSNPFNLETSPR